MPGASLGVAVRLLPTPSTMEHLPAREGEARERQLHRGGSNSRRSSSGNLREDILDLLPTPTATDQNDMPLLMTPVASEGLKAPAQQTSAVKSKNGQVWLSNQAKDMETNWGKFEPAIRRWEQVTGMPAPAPTKPDGKDGAHRLSSEFTEWMMGLPAGWITSVGLKRAAELKACGNGVVPQQAELALRTLLDGVDWRG